MNEKLLGDAERRRAELLTRTGRLAADLPLRFLRQQAQYTTPASNFKLAHGAATCGLAPTANILAQYSISPQDLATKLVVPLEEVEALLAAPPRAPLVMIDGEDAQALDEEVVALGRENATAIFRDADWGPTLRFYRPGGLNLPYCAARGCGTPWSSAFRQGK